MIREKQIEEMAKDLCGRADCATCGELMPCFSKHFSKRAVEKGYRKASDVAREIFEEFRMQIREKENINAKMFEYDADFYKGRIDAYITATNILGNIEKKYTEGEG